MLLSSQKFATLATLLPLLATAAPLAKESRPRPFYLKPNKDQTQLMMVVVDTHAGVYGGAPVSIRSVDYATDGRIVYDLWEFIDYDHSHLRLRGTKFCLDATSAHPSSFTELEVWPCDKGLPAQFWQYTPTVVSAHGVEQAKLSIDSGEQCLDWKDGSTDIAQAYECISGNQNQLWIKTNNRQFSPITSVYGGITTRVVEEATVTTIQAPRTTTAGYNGVSSVVASIQGGPTAIGGTGVYATSTMAQADNVPSSRLVPSASGVVFSSLALQATGKAEGGGTTTAQQPGATSASAVTPVTSSAENGDAMGATSVAVPILSSSIAVPAVQTVVVGGTHVRRADIVLSSVLGEVINGNGATSTRANGMASTSLVPVVSTSTSRAANALGGTTSLAPSVTSSSALHGVTTSVLTVATSTSVAINAPTPSTLVLLIPNASGINGSFPSNGSEIQKWTCYRE